MTTVLEQQRRRDGLDDEVDRAGDARGDAAQRETAAAPVDCGF